MIHDQHSKIWHYSASALILAVVFACGCAQIEESHAVRRTLRLAGSNREELEKVLDHYAGEPLKERAARHMIAHMNDAHYMVGCNIDSIKSAFADIATHGIIDAKRKSKWVSCDYTAGARKYYDAQVLNANYLIENIDLAFASLERWPWGQHYSFKDFCKYILPYRIGDEEPDHWRQAYADTFSPIMDSIYSGTDVVEAVVQLHAYLKKNTSFVYENDFTCPHLGGEFLLHNNTGDCREGTDMVTYILRSLGIPAATDSYRYSPDAYLGHSWNVFMDTTGLFLPTEYGRATTQRDWYNHCSKGKVYRGKEDVTDMYFPANKVELPHLGRNKKGGFIGVFSIDGWIPIGTYKRNLARRAYVKNIETEQVYLPMDAISRRPTGHPFYINADNTASPLIPDLDCTRKVRLTRKHPLTEYWAIASEYQDSVCFYGSVDGRNWTFLAVSNTSDVVKRERHLYPRETQAFKYIKICPRADKRLSIAEIEVFADSTGKKPLHLSVAKAAEPLYGQTDYSAANCLDGQNLTRFESGEAGAPLILQMDHASRVGRIDHAPYNDDNYVIPGDTYELYYHDGLNGWVSLGVQTATEVWLEFDGVPDKALLWLHDRTKGKEEQAFRWIDNKQVFCYEEYYKRRGHRHYL